MNQLLFLYNPTSGKGGAAGHLSTILDTLTKEGWLVTTYPTQQPGDATRIVQELGARFDRVVCCGGDGTLSETAAGLMKLEQPPVLGYIPAGSTNDCATTLHIPRVYKKAAALAGSDIKPLAWDIGTLNDRPFVYVAAFGAFTEVAYDTPQDLKNTFGHLAYVMAGIASIPSIAPYHLKVEYDGQVPLTAMRAWSGASPGEDELAFSRLVLLAEEDRVDLLLETEEGEWFRFSTAAASEKLQTALEECDPDGSYFLEDLFEQCHGDDEAGWRYFPPEQFKLLLYFPESDTFLCSTVTERYAFDSVYRFDLSGKSQTRAHCARRLHR